MYKNIKFQNKLYLVFSIFILMVVFLSVFSIYTLNKVENTHVQLLDGSVKCDMYLSDAVRNLSDLRRYNLSLAYSLYNQTDLNVYHEGYIASSIAFMMNIDDYYNNTMKDATLTDAEKKEVELIINDIKDAFDNKYMFNINMLHEAVFEKNEEKINESLSICIPLGNQLTNALDALRERVNQNTDDNVLNVRQYAEYSGYTVVVFSLAINILALFVMFFMPRVIKAPIVKMEEAMEEIVKGNLNYPIRNGCKDELGMLSERIGDMVDNIAILNKHVTIIDNLDSMIFVTDFNYNIIYINQEAANFYNENKNELINKKCHEVCSKMNIPCTYCPLEELLSDKENLPSCEWENYMEEKNIWLLCKSSIIKWLDGSLVQIVIFKDNTLKKKHEETQKKYAENMRVAAETAREASRMKSVFLANMSHEIRTPMNGIIGFSELALSDDIADKTRNYLEKIKLSSESLLNIINDILDISKIEAGKITLENIPFDIHEVFKACQTVTSPKASEKGISLFCYAEPSIGKRLIGDPTRLRQALLNLLSNAVKFTHVGIVKLLSSIIKTDEDSITVHFEVKDSGIGMAAEQIDKIFEPFIQADDSTTRKYGGTGLGLAITKNIIELMGGKLNVESAQGVGSKFSFDITFKTIEINENLNQNKSMLNVIEKPIFKGNILVCEDNAMNQQVIKDHLSRVGINTVIKSNGKECVECVRNHINENKKYFDLIFMDIHMPVMDGLEAANLLSEMGNLTPIVALTANIMPNDREIYKKSGMVDCLAKPFTAQELWGCLLKYFTPLDTKIITQKEQYSDNNQLSNQLLKNFVKDNQDTFKNITEAIENGDVKLAHRLAHTLKSVAGLIGEVQLQETARLIENSLANGEMNISSEQMNMLKQKLDDVLEELSPLLKEENENLQIEFISKDESLKIFEKLEPLLLTNDTESLEWIDKLKDIPGTKLLIEQIEMFDFGPAHETLINIKNEWEK